MSRRELVEMLGVESKRERESERGDCRGARCCERERERQREREREREVT